ncbi:histone deacetylase [uncultured Sphingomonas sp.]|uniref:histone deacetylase family protein n=1 Tax=uncultured Sphingomonas sp. TaxID=158754 RepID=UPI0035CABB8F
MIHVVHHPAYVAPAPGSPQSNTSRGSPPARSTYRWNKNGLIRDLLMAEGDRIAWHRPDPTPLAALEAVHDPDYVAEVLEARVPAAKTRRIGFPVTPEVAARAAVVPGGTWLAARLALEHGYGANTAGGSHHALHDTGAGFCIFNDLAVAAVRLIQDGTVRRVAVVDVDVHQGDGTAALLAGRPGIATYSVHAEKNFPVRKARSTLDVPLADGVGDDEYLTTLEVTLAPFLDARAPDLILYQAGVDPYAGDRLGRLSLTREGLRARERLVAGLTRARGLPLASTVGGGYGDDAAEIAERHVDAILTLGDAFGPIRAG